MLTKLADGLWTLAAPLSLYGLQIGTRMTIVRLRDGGLLMHSPVSSSPELRSELDALGPLRHIVCPNLYHHMYAGPWLVAYPEARLHAPAGLARKRRDLPPPIALSEAPHPDWKDDLIQVPIAGSLLRETVFVHPRSRTVVSSDLVENFDTSDHLPTRIYLHVAGIHGKIGWSRLLRPLYRDRKAARASLDRLLEHDFDRVVVAHGRVVDRDGKAAVREAFTWL